MHIFITNEGCLIKGDFLEIAPIHLNGNNHKMH